MSCDTAAEPNKTTPDSDLGRLSTDLLSQDLELQELKKELLDVNKAFDTFKNDYSQLLTSYNETNDELQSLLHERSVEESGARTIPPDNTSELLSVKEKCRNFEIERDKYREMYLSAVESSSVPQTTAHYSPDDTLQLQQQVRDLADQVNSLESLREEMGLKIQMQAGERHELLDELKDLRVTLDRRRQEEIELQNSVVLLQEQVSVKNKVIEKLRQEYTELGDETTRLRAQVTMFQENKDNQEVLLNSANVNQDDIAKDYQALQYRCTETERREQEALLYIKDCLNLVEQTQHEKEQLVIQAAQSEHMRLEIEGTLSGLVEEASRRTLQEVSRVKEESNTNMTKLIEECGQYQERAADLEAELEEIQRVRDSAVSGPVYDTVLIADKDAVIYKLREYIKKLEEDKTNLTDQLLEVSNTMRATKEHFQSKVRSLENHLSSNKEKLTRALNERQALLEETTTATTDIETLQTNQRTLKNRINELQAILSASETQNSRILRDLQEEEEDKRDEMRRSQTKIVENLRRTIADKQNEVNRLEEQNSNSTYLLSTRETELNSTILTLSKKLKEKSHQHKNSIAEIDKLRRDQERDREKAFKTGSRLKAVDMQLTSANNQVSMVTENEAKLCSRLKELQLKIDELEFDLERSVNNNPPGVLNHSSLGNLIQGPPSVPLLSPRDRTKSSRKQDKKDRREKDQINKIFSSEIIRSAKKEKSRKKASTPLTDKSDNTIKFTDSKYQPGVSSINDGEESQ